MRIGIRLLCCAFALGLTPSHAGRAAEDQAQSRAENWNRLRSMPREERLALWKKLEEFDALGRAEQSAIRVLDKRIGQLPPSEQSNYGSVLRRYHHWVQGLSEAQRAELNALPPGERMRLVTKLRANERTNANGHTTPVFLQVIDFSVIQPAETAHRLKAWFELRPEERAEIEKIPARADQESRLAELGQHVKVGPVNRLTKGDEDALFAKMETNPQLKNWLAAPPKKVDPTKHEKMKRRLAANYYFLEHPPASVEPSNLMRFASAMPSWYREQFDHLPPEEARRRLTILYRLVFPAPGEMPAEIRKVSTPQKAASEPARKASPRPGAPAGANPF
jgi:hypothetical protein